MKGIVISGGQGKRLLPMTEVYQKQLLPLYDKPMVYYAISLLMLLKIKDIAILTTGKALEPMKKLMSNGEMTGLNIEYIVQEEWECDGIASAMLRCESFIEEEDFVMVLGDTLLFGAELSSYLNHAKNILLEERKAVVFESLVSNPTDFGTIVYNGSNLAVGIVEKSKSNINRRAIPGLYFLTKDAMNYAKKISKSARGEYEITSILEEYLNCNNLYIKKCGRGIIWIDTGTPKAIADAVNYIMIIQNNTGTILACLEEIAFDNGWISQTTLLEARKHYGDTEYGNYIDKIISEGSRTNIG